MAIEDRYPKNRSSKNEAGSSVFAISDRDMKQVGVIDKMRRFLLTGLVGKPPVIAREVYPFLSVMAGWSATDYTASSDAAYTTSGAGLAPITKAASLVETEIYPTYDRYISHYMGSRYTGFDMDDFIEYITRVIYILPFFAEIMELNKLLERTDWESIHPYSGEIPTVIEDKAVAFDAHTSGIRKTWLPLLRRLQTHILPPPMVGMIRRLTAANLMGGAGGIISLPTASQFYTGTTLASLVSTIEGVINELDTTYADVHNLMGQMLPFSIGGQVDVLFKDLPLVVDNDFESGWFNSGMDSRSAFDQVTPPDVDEMLIFADDTDVIDYQSINEFVPWGEVKMARVFEVIETDGIALISLHDMSRMFVYDDDGSYQVCDGANDTDFEGAYHEMFNCRYWDETYDYGGRTPERRRSWIDYDTYYLSMQDELMASFAIPQILEVISRTQAGSLQAVSSELEKIFNTPFQSIGTRFDTRA
jgi:hypothetical protein